MQDEEDWGRPEPWPFVQEPPPLQVTRRGGPREEQAGERALASVSVPPPLEIRRRGQDANRGSQTASQRSVATSVPKSPSSGSQVPQNASKPHSAPELSVAKKSEAGQASPTPQVEYVYVVIGLNRDEGSVHLCKIVTDLEFNRARRGIRQYFANLINSDYGRMREEREQEDLKDRVDYLKIKSIPVIPQHQARGVISRWDLHDVGDPIWEERPPDDDDDDTDDVDDRMELVGYEGAYVVYSWAVIKCKLSEIHRIDLNVILDD